MTVQRVKRSERISKRRRILLKILKTQRIQASNVSVWQRWPKASSNELGTALPAGWGRWLFSPCSTREGTAGGHQSWSHQDKKVMNSLEWGQENVTKMVEDMEYLTCERRLRDVSLRAEKAQWHLVNVYEHLTWDKKEDGTRLFSVKRRRRAQTIIQEILLKYNK